MTALCDYTFYEKLAGLPELTPNLRPTYVQGGFRQAQTDERVPNNVDSCFGAQLVRSMQARPKDLRFFFGATVGHFFRLTKLTVCQRSFLIFVVNGVVKVVVFIVMRQLFKPVVLHQFVKIALSG